MAEIAERGLLSGKTAFITGGAKGVGFAVADGFLRNGARVVVGDIDDAALGKAHVKLETVAPGQVDTVRLDVTDFEATEALADDLAAGGIDIVVPNAGILVLRHGVELDLATWRRVLDVNLTGAFITATSFARRMLAHKRGGRIIFTSSVFGLRSGVENSAYAASKFGITGLMQSLAAELAGNGILVNSVCPGQIGTAMAEQLFLERAALQGTTPEAVRGKLTAKIPLGDLGDLKDIAGAYIYLASDLSRYVVGQSLVVDGGWQVG